MFEGFGYRFGQSTFSVDGISQTQVEHTKKNRNENEVSMIYVSMYEHKNQKKTERYCQLLNRRYRPFHSIQVKPPPHPTPGVKYAAYTQHNTIYSHLFFINRNRPTPTLFFINRNRQRYTTRQLLLLDTVKLSWFLAFCVCET